ncbi:Uncharacterised protein [Bordetella pertussis]|nr:Uncharacterised protein [Bordetella pertussis]CFP67190.1 Uncharacterised protein [Bordetella pertussis]CFV98232.1 Uncharacterised protein [Bordetella pertussis]
MSSPLSTLMLTASPQCSRKATRCGAASDTRWSLRRK